MDSFACCGLPSESVRPRRQGLCLFTTVSMCLGQEAARSTCRMSEHVCCYLGNYTIAESYYLYIENILEIQQGCTNEKIKKEKSYYLTHRDNFLGTFDSCVCLRT